MVTVSFKVRDGIYQGFGATGHAGYAPIGQDIVCAAISALTQGTLSAIYKLSQCELEVYGNILGKLGCRIRSPDDTAQILMAGLEAALQELETEYGSYVSVCRE